MGLLGAMLLAAPTAPGPGAFDRAQGAENLDARIWVDRGDEPVLARGESVRVYYRASEDAFVAIFHLDTNGGVRLVFPRSPDEGHLARGGSDYRLLFPRSEFWEVEDDPGVGYFFLVASERPLDLSAFSYSHFDRGWDLSRVGRQVYRDPFVAMDDYVAALLPTWQSASYSLSFVSYHVGERHEYPRFLCYECHEFRTIGAWNPYIAECLEFRVVVASDPYDYPATRGVNVAFQRPGASSGPRFTLVARSGAGAGSPQLIRSPSVFPSAVAPGARPVLQPRVQGSGGASRPPP